MDGRRCGRLFSDPARASAHGADGAGPDPLDLLRSYRTKPELDGAVCFGMNCMAVEGDRQTVSIGQQVDLALASL